MPNAEPFLAPRRAALTVPVLWLSAPGLLLALTLFWQQPPILFGFWAGWTALEAALVFLHYGPLRVHRLDGELQVAAGTLLPSLRFLPLCRVSQTRAVTSPLLRRMGCCLLLIYLPGTVCLLPGVPLEAQHRVNALLRETP